MSAFVNLLGYILSSTLKEAFASVDDSTNDRNWSSWSSGQLLFLAVSLPLTYYSYQFFVWYRYICQIGAEVDKLPGPKTDWVVGNLFQHPGNNEKAMHWFIELNRKHGGKLFRWWLGPFRAAVALTHPETVKLVLRTAEPKAMKGNDGYSMIKPWLGDGLLVSSGPKWQRNRKLLTPAFHFDILKPYMKIYNETVDTLLDNWRSQLDVDPDRSIEICIPISLMTLDTILKCAFSYDSNVQRNDGSNQYVNYVLTLAGDITQRFFNLLWRLDWWYYRTSQGKEFAKKCEYVHQVAEEVIAKRKEALNNNADVTKRKHKDFLDILLLAKDDDGNGLSDLEIRNEVDTFLFEGHDTTSSALSWCLYNLASHPEIQQRVYEEVESIVNGRDNSNITWEDLGEMTYLTMCIKESLRLHPTVPFIGRELTMPLEIEGVTLLPGTIIDIMPWTVHHNPCVWGDNHMDYCPERFSVDNMKNMDSHAFIPFSAGPRNCIGQSFAMNELKTSVSKILHRYRLEVDPAHPIEMLPELVLRAKYDIKLILVPRS